MEEALAKMADALADMEEALAKMGEALVGMEGLFKMEEVLVEMEEALDQMMEWRFQKTEPENSQNEEVVTSSSSQATGAQRPGPRTFRSQEASR